MKIASIVGARPQFIKAAVVSRVLWARGVEELFIHTGQHYDRDMSQVFFDELDVPAPDCNLGVGSGLHGEQTGRMLQALEPVLARHRPDWVLVYGDTNSTLAGALAAVKLHLPVAHVEAGLRSFDRRMPEEINRVLTDQVSEILFAPTDAAVENLRREGIATRKIHRVGDVMYDAARYYGGKAEHQSRVLRQLDLETKRYLLATVHRAENTDHPGRLEAIFAALIRLGQEMPVVVPLHPRTRKALSQIGLLEDVALSICLIEPVGYLDMVMLEKNARLIVTDSGGVQKEAFFYQVPCLTLREQTEWVELVAAGWNSVVYPQDPDRVVSAAQKALQNLPPSCANPYGDGDSAAQIVDILLRAAGVSAACESLAAG